MQLQAHGFYFEMQIMKTHTVVLGRTLCAYGRVIWTETDTKDVFCVVDFLPSSDGLSRRPISKQVSVLSCH